MSIPNRTFSNIQLRRGAAAIWTANNPILLSGEVGIETDTNKLKIGNGTDAWNDLDYFVGGGTVSLGLDQLTDVDTTGVADGDALVYDAGTSTWVPGESASSVFVSDTAPTSPSSGDLWYDTNGGSLYIYYNDGTSSQWVSVRLAEPAVPTDLSINTLRLTSTTDVSATSTGHALQIGPTSGANLRLDINEIQTLSNGAVTTLFVQNEGGTLNVGSALSSTTTHAFRGWYRKQDLPAFQATGTTTQTLSGSATTTKLVLGSTQVNNGNHYSTVNSRFTAPVAGLYQFSFNTAQTTTVTGPEIEIFVNGSQRYGDIAIGYVTSYMTFGGSWILNLAANDFVEIYFTNNNGVTVTLDRTRTWFSGFYLG